MSKRKYRKGGPILSLDELARQEFVYVDHKITHCGWFQSWQFGYTKRMMEQGRICYAIKETPDKIVCNKCGRKFKDEDELQRFVEAQIAPDDVYIRKYIRGEPLEEGEVIFRGCPNCKCDAYLMDLEEKK
ncbi:MAG: hypothetical protein E7607_01030 [Ruminococcaceae bacterium]|nr:hypothetical protein [Oscillospiraceae bacterium]